MSIADRLQRQHLRDLTPYASARRSMSGGAVWLNANEAPLTPSQPPDGAQANRYPAFQSSTLNQAYASYAGVSEEQLLSCRGSDEAIDLLIRTFCEPGQDRVMICPPTYGMYAISAQTHGAGVTEVPLIARGRNLQLDLAAIYSQLDQVKLIFICSPSNPLGNELATDDLENLLEQVGERALVVVDQAYIEFAATGQPDKLNQLTGWLARYPQLVILRTLSKAFGLAAIRCGFALAGRDIIQCLRKVIAPYPLPQSTLDYATGALQPEAISAMHAMLTTVTEQRQRLLTALTHRQWVKRIWPSTTNFVLLSVTDAAALVASCAEQGVLIRNQSQQLNLSNSVRISIGSSQEMDQLLEALPA
ncbi:histidinol-phosphate aminotransferase [Pseudidiomarina salinarum]|uniref:Histidinol-phosphate aminotransferase n=1 Tax=Pseudidiomarina salinarum TaxID=435908 RepID=A0A094JGC1_9GAMM|nr:histidinol-phosphate transaminase [Pseudidiomarina salinarum]KFZ31616.1 histidinol-phosphate aminotransferase [Pseudidiomarina salinarum]RUO70616.1 histidinol-phosphate transaminase [Pseudidiomarina salinarum]